jgi:adenine-specific DNA-methyltransferase
VANALVRWAVRSSSDTVLDPSCGEGVFLVAAQARLAELGATGGCGVGVVGVDRDTQVAARVGAIQSDFFAWAGQHHRRFDAVVGNPPFIRSHLFDEESRVLAFAQMRAMGLRPSRLMSTWAPFVVVSCRLLAEGGRLAFVVPEELLHVRYAEELRQFLLRHFRRVIVCMMPGEVFPAVQQAVVLLLCDNEATGSGGLCQLSFAELEQGSVPGGVPAPAWGWSTKWTHLFLSEGERSSVDASFGCLGWERLSAYGRVEVGVVTGFNKFFIVPRHKAQQLGNGRYFKPIVTSARDLSGIDLTEDDFRLLVDQGRPSFVLHTVEPESDLSLALQAYLNEGVEGGIHQRFKCRTRVPWYGVPSVWNAHALLLRQAGTIPKMVHLSCACTATDTIHRVRWKAPHLGRRHVVSFLNVWTLLACELMGRSYGGGVLELMPGEANALFLPPPVPALDAVVITVDGLVRQRQFEDAVDVVSRVVCPSGFSGAEYEHAVAMLARLIRRRSARRGTFATSTGVRKDPL